MVLPDSNGVSRAPPYSGAFIVTFNFAYKTFTSYGSSFQMIPLSIHESNTKVLQPQKLESLWFRLFPGRSPLLGKSLLISLPSGTEMFHFPEFALLSLYIQLKSYRTLLRQGSPIRKSSGQCLFDSSPKLIAAYHVLLRLLTPRHPPVALNILFFFLPLLHCQ